MPVRWSAFPSAQRSVMVHPIFPVRSVFLLTTCSSASLPQSSARYLLALEFISVAVFCSSINVPSGFLLQRTPSILALSLLSFRPPCLSAACVLFLLSSFPALSFTIFLLFFFHLPTEFIAPLPALTQAVWRAHCAAKLCGDLRFRLVGERCAAMRSEVSRGQRLVGERTASARLRSIELTGSLRAHCLRRDGDLNPF